MLKSRDGLDDVIMLCFGNNKCYDELFLKSVFDLVCANDLLTEFTDKACAKVKEVFWNSDNPSLPALINLLNLNLEQVNVFEERNEFLYTISTLVDNFPVECLSNIRPLVAKFLDSCDSNYELPDELGQQLDDAFGVKKVPTIMATMLIKLGSRTTSVDDSCNVFKLSIECLQRCCDSTELQELRKNSTSFFVVSLPAEKFLLLQSYFIQVIQDEELTNVFLEKCTNVIAKFPSPQSLTYLYKAYSNVFGVNEIERLVHFMLRDFDAGVNEVTLALIQCFNKMYKLDARAICVAFIPKITEISWKSKMKRFVVPYLAAYGNADLAKALICEAGNPQSRNYIVKCIKEIEEKHIGFLVDGIASMNAPLPVGAIFLGNSQIAAKCLNCLPDNSLARISIVVDAINAWPSLFIAKYDRRELRIGLTASDPDLRIRSFACLTTAFSGDGDDLTLLRDVLDDSLLMIEAPNSRGKLVQIVKQLVAKFDSTCEQHMLCLSDIIASCCKRFVPSTGYTWKKTCLDICEVIWTRYPDRLTTEDKKKLECLKTCGNENLEKRVVKWIDPKPAATEPVLPSLQSDATVLHSFRVSLNECSPKVAPDYLDHLLRNLPSMEWTVMGEWYRILSICSLSTDQQVAVVKLLFATLLSTRDVGFVLNGSDLLHLFVAKRTLPCETISFFTDTFRSVLHDFDMKQMRRSAALPHIALALMSYSTDTKQQIFTLLIELGKTTSSAEEVTNVLNTLRFIIRVCDLDISNLSCVFMFIFQACKKFSLCYDAMAAVNLTYATLLNKIWEVIAKETTFQNLSREKFFAEIADSRSVIIEHLSGTCLHSLYLALLLLQLFPSDFGDPELVRLIENVSPSRSSRIRRTAARALVASLNIDLRQEYADALCRKLPGMSANQYHASLLILHELQQRGVRIGYISDIKESSIPMIKDVIELLKGTEFDWKNADLSILIQKLLCWPKNKPSPDGLVDHLLETLIVPEFPTKNTALQLVGTRFLVQHLSEGSISSEKSSVLVCLIPSISEPELQALLISLLRYSSSVDLTPLIDMLVDMAAAPSSPIHFALSQIIHIVIQQSSRGYEIAALLILNDLATVRCETARSLHMDTINEITIAKEMISKCDRVLLCTAILEQIRKHIDDPDPLTLFIDEFKLIFLCFPELEREFQGSGSLRERRMKMLSLCDLHHM